MMIHKKIPWMVRCIVVALAMAAAALSSAEPADTAARPATPRPLCHFKPLGRWLGDAHPLFDQGCWRLFYLSVPAEPMRSGLDEVRSDLAESADLIHWTPVRISSSDAARNWWAIANIRRGGVLWSFFNASDGIGAAMSRDCRHWIHQTTGPVVAYSDAPTAELRDPFVTRDDARDRYLMVFAARTTRDAPANTSGAFLVSESRDLASWTHPRILHNPGCIGVPECPALFPLGPRWYLMGSWGTDRVGMGRYRVADTPDGPWRIAATEDLDGTEIMAPNPAWDGQRMINFGWIPTYAEDRDFASAEWGGHLAFPREIWAGPRGELYTRPVAELERLRGASLLPTAAPCAKASIGTWEIGPASATAKPGNDFALARLAPPDFGHQFEIKTTITLGPGCRAAGIVIRMGDQEFPGYEIVADLDTQRLLLRPHVERRRELASQKAAIRTGEPVELRVLVDGDIVEAFLGGRYSLAGRIHSAASARGAALYAQGSDASFSGIAAWRLTPVYTASEPPRLNLRPAPERAHSGAGECVLFPKHVANVYAAPDPALQFSGGFTLELWAKPTSGTGGLKRNLIIKGDRAKPGYHYGMNILADDSLELFLRAAGTTASFEGVCSPPGSMAGTQGRWVHVAGVFDPARREMRVYKDGALAGWRTGVTAALDAANTGALRLAFAAGLPGANQYYGLVDEVRLWSEPRTGAQIRESFAGAHVPPDSPNLVVHWPFNTFLQERRDEGLRQWSPNTATAHPQIRALLYDGAESFPEDSRPAQISGHQ
ncbi:MAG: GH32 C-terminal domain-containing protein [Candidatus Sumerlaeota bacterium]|nr:GH32 C-terminal domain-containing protein [Candidatus Sumerlaeota bacterium]